MTKQLQDPARPDKPVRTRWLELSATLILALGVLLVLLGVLLSEAALLIAGLVLAVTCLMLGRLLAGTVLNWRSQNWPR